MSWTRTFQPGQTECFVYIALPRQVELVIAGRFRLEADNAGGAVGRFRYGRSYLERPDAVPFDPIDLALVLRTLTTARMKGVFGALRDAGPDYRGRRVIERHASTTALSEIDYLLYGFYPLYRRGAAIINMVMFMTGNMLCMGIPLPAVMMVNRDSGAGVTRREPQGNQTLAGAVMRSPGSSG